MNRNKAARAPKPAITRKQFRAIKRERKAREYQVNGLNGPRAVARRRKQDDVRPRSLAA